MTEKAVEKNKKLIKVGIVRPISSMGNEHTEQHWASLHEIVHRALYEDEKYEFQFSLVSEHIGTHFIQSTIIGNLYNDHVVICDTSKHNPNVLYELGLRMAFQKPCIIIQEKGHKVAFDLSLVKYEEYPFDFNYLEITHFQEKIREAVISCYIECYEQNLPVSYSSIFDKANVKPAKIKETKINEFDYLDGKINALASKIPNVNDIVQGVILGMRNAKQHSDSLQQSISRKTAAEAMEARRALQKSLSQPFKPANNFDEEIPF